MKLSNKNAAIELSVGTIIIIVLGVTMLILGMVLVRSVMCNAIGLTGDINTKVSSEINKYFGDSGSEVACIGSGGDAIKLATGQQNIIYCGIKAPASAKYDITVTQVKSGISTLTDDQLKQWLSLDTWSSTVAPGDTLPKKVARINIPSNAPEGSITIQVQINKDGQLLSTQDLDFTVSRVGTIQTAIC